MAVRQGHVEGFRSKKEENISSKADDVQELSSGTKKNAEIILPRIICTSLRKSCPILLGGFPLKVKLQAPTEMKASIIKLESVYRGTRKKKFTYYR